MKHSHDLSHPPAPSAVRHPETAFCRPSSAIGKPPSGNRPSPSALRLPYSIVSYFENKDEVVAVYLFGSRARGLETPESDVDIGILLDIRDKTIMNNKRTQYLTELGRILRKDIHPVILNTAGEALMKQIFEKGKCIVVNNRSKHAHFRMTMFSRIAAFGYYRRRMQAGFVRNLFKVTSLGRS